MGRRWLRRLVVVLGGTLFLVFACVWFLSEGITGERHLRGEIVRSPIPGVAVAARMERRRPVDTANRDSSDTQILFGDLHVHTTYSGDAFVFSLPLFQGEGVHPPADACDFARFCAELDFWSINDHAENLAPWQWTETKESIRECNEVAGSADNPDLVSFLGWEWTQSAPLGERTNFGHKNVIFRDTADDAVPARPIGAGTGDLFSQARVPAAVWTLVRAGMTLGDLPTNLGPYLDFNAFAREARAMPECADGIAERDLPSDCAEGADDPAKLFAKLDDWGFPSLVIPHGTTWGIHAPPDSDLRTQLTDGNNDPGRQRLFEVYSGHGSSELFATMPHVATDADGNVSCPEPQGSFVPCCWQAGEIIRSRCGDATSNVCNDRVARARRAYAELWPKPVAAKVVPGATADDWAECGQLAGGFLPALDYRPAMSAQYGLAVRPQPADAADGAAAGAFRYGLVGSSDNHKARSGAGYKEIARKAFGDAYGFRQDWIDRLSGKPTAPSPEPVAAADVPEALGFIDPGSERAASYYYTAGLVAAHADGRDRDSIWNALEARRVYGTSGPRILLWFDLDNAPNGPAPMGSAVPAFAAAPRFSVRAVGSFKQLPGCPQHTIDRLSPERLRRLCLDECYHPSDTRHRMQRIEVVRIRPQISGEEPIDRLIEDPWRVFECPLDDDACSISFEDPDWSPEREHLYYVRALQEPTDAVNGDPMRCERDQTGRCIRARVCAASGQTFNPADECLAPVNERAWSSPIWIVPRGRG